MSFTFKPHTEAVSKFNGSRTITKMLGGLVEVTTSMDKRSEEGGRKKETGSRGNGLELIKSCLQYRARKTLVRLQLLPDSSYSLLKQEIHVFRTDKKPQAACNYMLTLMVSSQDDIGVFGSLNFPILINIHEGRTRSSGLCCKKSSG